jgi:hypothetical protein
MGVRVELTTGTRCPPHQQQHNAQRWANKGGRYNGTWRTTSKQAIAHHTQQHGMMCPGWQRPPHPAHDGDLVTDHDVGVLCRACNGVKAATFDKR